FHPQDVSISYENGWANLYLKPNDSLFIEFDPSSLEQDTYELSGSNPTTSENIRDFFRFHNPYSYEPKYGDSVSIEEYLSDLEQQMSIEDSVLHVFIKQYNPTEEFVHWAKKNNRYSIAGNLLLYFWHFDVNHNQYKTEIYDTDLFPVDDDAAIVSGAYLTHLNNYVMAKYFKGDTVLIKFSEKKDVIGAYTRIFERLINIEQKSLSRDILHYMLFGWIFRDNSKEEAEILFKNFGSNISNKLLYNILQKKKSRIESQDEKQETILDLKLNSKSETVNKFWKSISTKHKNKIIYIDIWATWCGPCRSEIPHAIDLHNSFEDKQVAFVNLCLASSRDDWEKSVIQNHIKGDNYFFNEDETAILREELKFHGYPTYMIINKKGKFVNKNAPRPSSGGTIKDLLNKLIEE
ncbi:MAG: TlpA disulfide reductase family protein, partial [Bacteroidota bacterium]